MTAVTAIAAVITRSINTVATDGRYGSVDASFSWNAGTGQWRRK
jgi:hypothetical protein